jgi:parallel beta-helix repeat protein
LKNRIAIGILLTLFLMGMLTLAFNISPSKAGGAIYIRADGSIEGTDKIERDGDNYTLTGNITDAGGIVIQRGNMTLDGAGYVLRGGNIADSRGIEVTEETNVTIKNMKIETFESGVWIDRSTDCWITESHIRNCSYNGIHIRSASNIQISGCHIAENLRNGIFMEEYSSNNTIFGNLIESNNLDGITRGGGVTLHYSSNNSIFQNTITNNYDNIELWYSSDNNEIHGNNITNALLCGIMLTHCTNNIYENEITGCNTGIDFWDASGSMIHKNRIVNNECGIHTTRFSGNNQIYNNEISSNNETGIEIYSSFNLIYENIISENEKGISLLSYWPKNNTIYANNITDNNVGVELTGYAANNTFYSNRFVDNTQQVQVSGVSLYPNFWSGDYSIRGNFWSDFTTRYPSVEDTKSGPYQNETGSDGVWDSPYAIDTNNQDKYPIVPEFPSTIILPLFMALSAITIAFTKKKTAKNKT